MGITLKNGLIFTVPNARVYSAHAHELLNLPLLTWKRVLVLLLGLGLFIGPTLETFLPTPLIQTPASTIPRRRPTGADGAFTARCILKNAYPYF